MRAVSIADLGDTVRGRRIDLEWSQGELARRSGVSRKWVVEFEAGKGTAQLVMLLRVLDALALDLDIVPQEAGLVEGTVDLDAIIEAQRDG